MKLNSRHEYRTVDHAQGEESTEGQAPRTRALSASFARCRSHESALSSDALCPRAGASGGSGGGARCRCRDRSAHQAGRAPLSRISAHTSHYQREGRRRGTGGGRGGGGREAGGAPAARLATRRRRAPVRLPLRYPRAPVPDRERGTRDGVRRTWAAASRRPAAGVR